MEDLDVKVTNDDRQVVNVKGLPPSSNIKIYSSDSDESVELKKPKIKNEFNYSMYADPRKIINKEEEEEEDEYSEDSEDSENSEDQDEENDTQSEKSEIRTYPKKQEYTISQLRMKKKDLLLKLHDAEQSGYQLIGKYNMNSELEDMEAEYDMYVKRIEQNAMIDMLQDGLLFIVKAIEVLNGFYKPMGINLSGLSDKIHDRKENLEHVLKRLAIKYSGGTEMPPELSLLFILMGAIVTTAITNHALKGDGLNSIINGLNLGGMLNSIMKPQQNTPLGSANGLSQQQQFGSQPVMKPPNLDIASILNKMVDIPSAPPSLHQVRVPPPSPFPQSTRTKDIQKEDRFSVTSDASSDNETINFSIPSKSTSTSKTSNKKQKKNIIQI